MPHFPLDPQSAVDVHCGFASACTLLWLLFQSFHHAPPLRFSKLQHNDVSCEDGDFRTQLNLREQQIFNASFLRRSARDVDVLPGVGDHVSVRFCVTLCGVRVPEHERLDRHGRVTLPG